MSKNIKDGPAFALERKVSHKEGGGTFPRQLACVIQEFIQEKEMPIPQLVAIPRSLLHALFFCVSCNLTHKLPSTQFTC